MPPPLLATPLLLLPTLLPPPPPTLLPKPVTLLPLLPPTLPPRPLTLPLMLPRPPPTPLRTSPKRPTLLPKKSRSNSDFAKQHWKARESGPSFCVQETPAPGVDGKGISSKRDSSRLLVV